MLPDGAPTDEVPASSRLCVKNIPKYVDEARLKEFFSAKGEVTDVKVLRTKDGRSRQLGFIGFKTVDEAAVALRYYSKSYMDTMKLEVEFARKVGDEQLPRAWSKHTSGTSANRKTQAPAGPAGEAVAAAPLAGGKGKNKNTHGEPLPEEEDPKLREFMALMQPRAKARIWANDELPTKDAAAADAAARQPGSKATGGKDRSKGKQQQEGGDEDEDEEYQDWTGAGEDTRGGRGGAGRLRDDMSIDGDEEDGDEEGDLDGGDGMPRGGPVDQVVVNEAVSDLEYLRCRMKRWDEDDEDEDDKDKDGDAREGKEGMRKTSGGAAAAARGDQSGVGTSPRCAAEGGIGGSGGLRKAGARSKAGRGRGGGGGGDSEGDGHGSSGGSEEEGDGGNNGADGAADGTAAAEGPRSQQRWKGAAAAAAAGASAADEGEDVADSGRLFVRNLAYTATETELSELFGAHGDLQEVHLVLDRETKRSKGLAYVQFQIPEDAVSAAQQLDGTIYQGRLLHILPARKAPGAAAGGGGGAAGAEGEGGQANEAGGPPGTSTFKAQREAQRKADAGNRSAWNTLFMRADTVAEAVAAHYGLSKAALLDASTTAGGGGGAGDSVAVRMALGEAQVIAATKTALGDAGVNIDALEAAAAASGKASAVRSVARSGTTLLVKNLPYSADEDELLELFGRYGPVSRLVLPPAKALALVEFTEPQDARSAFRSLAYKKYHHVPLYLEWAPADVFTSPPPPPAARQAGQGAAAGAGKTTAPSGSGVPTAAAEHEKTAAAMLDSTDADGDAEGTTAPAVLGTIYVKNLAFATTDAALRKHFDGAVSAVGGSLHAATVARKKAKDGAVQSLGYGFVEVDSEAVAAAVIKKLQGSMLDGHKLALQLSKGRKAAAGGAGASTKVKKAGAVDGESTKLVVRNLAFEATKKEIQGLFNPFGHQKSCRLPKKFDGSHRGFAFVEFVTKQEARNALEGVAGTHLYGRRLVVEYAKEDDGLEDLRNKIAAKFKRDEELEAGEAPAKRLKI